MTPLTPYETRLDIARPKLSFPVPDPLQESPWEGIFTANFQTGRSYRVPLKAVLRVNDSLLDGSGRSLGYPQNTAEKNRTFSISGSRRQSFVAFDIWFDLSSIAHRPWMCEGQLNDSGDLITGNWSMQCLDPPECACGGPSGPFELKRVR
ncbi:hypothetical protein [Hyphomonas sp.]|uniref:hypothetical protein n=1 Tax=Hyphomonas sp. TaxID=87 RepID=UPI00391AD2F6